jgi:hypothetical protein
MRRALVLMLSAGLLAAGMGCSKACQHTAGVCDCNPPPVDSVLHPYTGLTPAPVPVANGAVANGAVAAPVAPVTPAPPTAMPKVVEPPLK